MTGICILLSLAWLGFTAVTVRAYRQIERRLRGLRRK